MKRVQCGIKSRGYKSINTKLKLIEPNAMAQMKLSKLLVKWFEVISEERENLTLLIVKVSNK